MTISIQRFIGIATELLRAYHLYVNFCGALPQILFIQGVLKNYNTPAIHCVSSAIASNLIN